MTTNLLIDYLILSLVPQTSARRWHRWLQHTAGCPHQLRTTDGVFLHQWGMPWEVIKFIQQHPRKKENIKSIDSLANECPTSINSLSRQIEKTYAWLDNKNHHLVCLADPRYPPLLKTLIDAPLVLYVIGNPTLLAAEQFALVGSRKATPSGQSVAYEFAADLARQNFVVTSGLAYGIDAASHRGTLAYPGHTIAVLGHGLHMIYPRSHENLAQQIVEQQGALVSEFALDTGVLTHHFPQRNRIISGLSQAVLVIEAAKKSGSLITAACALDQGREVGAIPGSIKNSQSSGCHALIQQGAHLITSIEDLLAAINMYPKSIPQSRTNLPLTAEIIPLLHAIAYHPTTIDEISALVDWPIDQINSLLLILELQGYIKPVGGGYQRLCE